MDGKRGIWTKLSLTPKVRANALTQASFSDTLITACGFFGLPSAGLGWCTVFWTRPANILRFTRAAMMLRAYLDLLADALWTCWLQNPLHSGRFEVPSPNVYIVSYMLLLLLIALGRFPSFPLWAWHSVPRKSLCQLQTGRFKHIQLKVISSQLYGSSGSKLKSPWNHTLELLRHSGFSKEFQDPSGWCHKWLVSPAACLSGNLKRLNSLRQRASRTL